MNHHIQGERDRKQKILLRVVCHLIELIIGVLRSQSTKVLCNFAIFVGKLVGPFGGKRGTTGWVLQKFLISAKWKIFSVPVS